MKNIETDNATNTDEHDADQGSIVGRLLIILLILGAAAAFAFYMIKNPAKSEKKDTNVSSAALVETMSVQLGHHPVIIDVMGQVIPAREATLKAQVSGKILNVADQFAPGGFLQKDEEILRIDPADYALDIKVKTASMRQSGAALKLEMGQQSIAKDELKILEKSTGKKLRSSDLALRKPQLEQARANHDSAKANLELSELNLERTILSAPFNALITQRDTNVGNVIGPQDTLATLVGTDEYWISAEIPVQHLRWLSIPKVLSDTGTKALIELDGGRGQRAGHLLRTNGSIDTQTRLAGILVSVPDPLALTAQTTQKTFPLILGDYVKVSLIGKELQNVARIEQSYVRDNNSVWLEKDHKLIIQPITIAYADRTYAYITNGIAEGDRLITSNIITPVHGMDVRLPEDAVAGKAPPSSDDTQAHGQMDQKQDTE
ncbi:MAG: efflux RND transporter periplasmic adaptor subunit [Alphaproteobacteria bacterium]